METDQLKTCPLKPNGLSESPTKILSVGEDLCFARGKKGLSIENVSHALRIPVVYLSALEADDFARIPGSTYVKGYLRAYGRLLGLASDKLIQKYEQAQSAQLCSQEHSETVLKTVKINSQVMYHKKRPSPLLSLGALALAAVLFFSYFYWQSGDYAGASPPGIQKFSIESANGDLIVEDLSYLESMKVSFVEAQSNTQQPSIDVSQAVTLPQSVDTVLSENAVKQAVVSSGALNAELTAHEDGGFLSDSLSQIVDSITLQAKEQCWVKVTDSKGGTLHVALMEAGESKSLSGSGPFQLVLGNAKGIRVQFNGEEVDLEAYQHKQSRVAVLKLGS